MCEEDKGSKTNLLRLVRLLGLIFEACNADNSLFCLQPNITNTFHTHPFDVTVIKMSCRLTHLRV